MTAANSADNAGENTDTGERKGVSAEDQSSAAGRNEADDQRKPSEPGMVSGIGKAAASITGNAEQKASEKENADLEQQYKETLTERD